MEEAAVYDRALDDAEIGQLCRKPLAIRWPNEMVHYKPFDYPLGDVRPEFMDGVYYLSYLYNPPSYESAIIQSTDLINWQRVQPTHTPPPAFSFFHPTISSALSATLQGQVAHILRIQPGCARR